MKKEPLVSVIIRTCGRPHVLRTALDSVRKQTFSEIEVVIVEDGKNTAEEMLKKEYSDLNYIYEATGEKQGRCRVGNRAMELASGIYLNFLDDDDLLFPEHVEQLVEYIKKHPQRAVYSVAEEHQIQVDTANYEKTKVRKKLIRYRQPFNRLLLYTMNYIPIQSVLFEKSLFDELGGLDEQLDTLEDWDLWVRYSTVTDFGFVDKVTSCYHTPYERRKKRDRAAGLKDYTIPLYKKFESYPVEMSVKQIHQEMEYVIREYKSKGLMRYLRIFFRMFFLGER